MIDRAAPFNTFLVALALLYATSFQVNPASAQEIARDADTLLNRLGTLTAPEDSVEAARLAAEIEERWSHSGSDAMDLLLTRGMEAIEAGDYDRAITHLTALTDHAPQFAEGWNARASAFFLSENFGPALSDIEQVLILEPRHFGALFGLGVILAEMGEPEAALRAFRRVEQVYPTAPNLADAIARLTRDAGERAL